MKVEYIFSNNNKIGSKLISHASKWEKDVVLDDYPSHAAVLLNEEIVIESTFTSGVRMLPYSKWIEINHEVARIPCINLHRPSTEVFKLLSSLWGKKYDWKGILFFSWSFIKLKLFKEKLSETNEWQRPNKYFCTEFVGLLSGIDCSMKTPARMLHEWSNQNP